MAPAFRFSAGWTQPVLALLLGAQSVVATSNLIFRNNCDHNLYYWVIPPQKKETDTDFYVVTAHGEGVHPMQENGGTPIKIRDLPMYVVAPAGIVQAEYNLESWKNSLWYDFSAIDCIGAAGPESPSYCPFLRGGARMYVPGQEHICPTAKCALGGICDKNTYRAHGSWKDEPSFSCPFGSDVVLEVCTEGPAERTYAVDIPLALAPVSSPLEVGPPVVQSPPSRPQPMQPSPPLSSHVILPGPNGEVPTSMDNVIVTEDAPAADRGEENPTTKWIPPSPDWRPQVYDAPPGFPPNIVCFDEQCICYGSFDVPLASAAVCPDGIVECYFLNQCEDIAWDVTWEQRWVGEED